MSQVHDWKYVDPEKDNPSRKGMLLSNEIDRFRQADLLISRHFEPHNLRPAAYTLRVGSKFVDSRGRPGQLDEKKKPYFKMEPNSIVYVSTYEELDLPYYIVARFNLRVKWVYKGILLGTGPQVEPGYRGYLSCPLYNLTDRPIQIEFRQDFATIDFERTTDFCSGAQPKEIRDAIKTGDVLDSIEWQGKTYLVFKQKDYPPLKLLPDHDVISSLFELSHEVKTWRNIGIGFAVSFFALTLTLLSFGGNIYRQASDLANAAGQMRNSIQDLMRQQQGMQSDVRALQQRLSSLENKVAADENSRSKK